MFCSIDFKEKTFFRAKFLFLSHTYKQIPAICLPRSCGYGSCAQHLFLYKAAFGGTSWCRALDPELEVVSALDYTT